MVRQLGPVTPTAELAAQLTAAGLTTGNGRPFDTKAVQWIRHAYHIPAPATYANGEISVAKAASQLGCSTGTIYHWIHTGQLAARRSSGNRLCIPGDGQDRAGCQELITQSAHLGRAARPRMLPAPPSPAGDGEVSVTEAAYQLGCSTYVIYDWIETGKLAARRGTGNRLHIPWDEQMQAECRARIEQSGHLNPAARKDQAPAAALSGNVSASGQRDKHKHHTRGQRRSHDTGSNPTRDCRRSSLKSPSRPSPTGWSRHP
jgi:excisionase family DNA binding protein